MKTKHRIAQLRQLLDDHKIDVLIITNLLNIKYLTGFSGSAGTLLIASPSHSKDDFGLLCTDGRYSEQAELQIRESGASVQITVGNNQKQFAASKHFSKGSPRIAIEPDSTSMTLFSTWTTAMEQTIAPSDVKIEALRQFKDEEEIAAIRTACQIADEALTLVLPRLSDEPTENEFAAELEFQMRMLGAQGPSFETIVASGPNSAMPHARPTNRRMTEGDTVIIDFGAIWNGYHSDCTRTYFLGDGPTEQFKRIYSAVESAHEAGVSLTVQDEEISAVDRACRESLATNNLAEFFTHSTGHGVGLEVHELPWVHGDSKSSLKNGVVITVEPGVYIAGELGVRIEDTIAITRSGSEILTRIAKSPLLP